MTSRILPFIIMGMRKVMLVIEDFNELVALEAVFRRVGLDVLSLSREILVGDALLHFRPDLVCMSAKGRAVDGPRLAAKLKTSLPTPRVAFVFPATQHGQVLSLIADGQRGLVDGLIETPVHPQTVIRTVSQLLGLEADALLEKLDRLAGRITRENELIRVTSGAGETDSAVTVRGSHLGAEPAKSSDGVPALAPLVGQEKSRLPEQRPSDEARPEWNPRNTPGTAASVRSSRSDRYDRFLKENSTDDVSGTLARENIQKAMERLKERSQAERERLDRIDEAKREFIRTLFAMDPAKLESEED